MVFKWIHVKQLKTIRQSLQSENWLVSAVHYLAIIKLSIAEWDNMLLLAMRTLAAFQHHNSVKTVEWTVQGRAVIMPLASRKPRFYWTSTSPLYISLGYIVIKLWRFVYKWKSTFWSDVPDSSRRLADRLFWVMPSPVVCALADSKAVYVAHRARAAAAEAFGTHSNSLLQVARNRNHLIERALKTW